MKHRQSGTRIVQPAVYQADNSEHGLGEGQVNDDFSPNLKGRNRRAAVWNKIFAVSTGIGLVVLTLLMINITNNAFGYVVLESEIRPEDLVTNGQSLEEMGKDDLAAVFKANVSSGLYRRFESETPMSERSAENIYNLIQEWVIKPQVVKVYPFFESLFNGREIKASVQQDADHPGAYVQFMSWLDIQFIKSPQEAEPLRAGVRTAILGSLWTIAIAILFAFPVGVAAAIYLEEYAKDTTINRIIQTNISNLAGVPSIIYGLLGLAVFVRALVNITSGSFLGLADADVGNGRTVLSAGLTLGLLVLPMIIINSQEAIRAVPGSLRQASMALGATQWQTIWYHVLPAALPGILTGTILSISRAIGETAPLVVIGASTYITSDPTSPFSKFTTLPIQIYQWTSRPQDEFRSLAAAAIIVLLFLLLSLNAVAIVLRNRFSQKQEG